MTQEYFVFLGILFVSIVVALFYQFLKTSPIAPYTDSEGFLSQNQNSLDFLPERMTMTRIPSQYHSPVWTF
jgi:hypothetical protein